MAEGLDGKVVIVTGAGGGLGRTHSLLLAERGAQVVVNDLGGSTDGTGSDGGAAQGVVDEIAAKGGTEVSNRDSVATPEGAQGSVQTAFPPKKEQGFGRFVHTTSGAGLFGNFGQANYGAAKMGICGFFRTLAEEGARYGITVRP